MDIDIDEISALDIKFFSILKNISSSNRKERYEAVQSVRKILSVENNPPIDRVIEAGLVPILHKYLVDETDFEIQYEASWALTNVASGSSEHTNYIVENEIHKSIIDLLSTSSNFELLEQNIWALGNIIGDSSQHRDSILNEGIVLHLVEILKTQTKKSLVSNISWTISNLCRGTPRPAFRFIKPLLPSIKNLLVAWSKETDIISDTLWALSFLTEATSEENEIFSSVISIGLVEIIIHLISTSHINNWIIPGFRTIGNMLSGPDDVADHLLNCNVLKVFPKFLSSSKPSLVKEAFWCLSNITSGPQNQIQRVIDEGLMKRAIETGKRLSTTPEILREVTWAIINAITGASQSQLINLIKMDCLQCLKQNYSTAQTQANLFHYYLDGVSNLLRSFITQVKSFQSLELFNTFIETEFFEQLIEDSADSESEFIGDYERLYATYTELTCAVKELRELKISNNEKIDEIYDPNNDCDFPNILKTSIEFDSDSEEDCEDPEDYEEDLPKINEMDLDE
ncbi:hypothetical protein RB653_004749 [Dictyostelium firmibasis]|uniref:Importin subunit alpha n=1 Tax=Dictyostelium firmibasis TaxID=79012 RepID=A0AAN7YSJ1_9MYCE